VFVQGGCEAERIPHRDVKKIDAEMGVGTDAYMHQRELAEVKKLQGLLEVRESACGVGFGAEIAI
jgi:hypothetical protein